MKRMGLLFCLLILASCSVKSSKEVAADLWAGWEKAEIQMQSEYPDAVPLILVHGWNGGEFTWPDPEQLIEMEKKMGRDIYLFTYRTGIFANRYPPLEVLEEQLDRYIEAYKQVDIIAHSMGGLLVRHYLSHHAVSNIRRVVFLATPHFGTNAAQVLVKLGSIGSEGNIQATEIQPGSDFLWQLNSLAGSELDGVDVLNVYAEDVSLLKSDFVVSTVSSYLPWAHNVTVPGRHDTLAKHLIEFDLITDFVQNGVQPSAVAVAPVRRDAWLRFKVSGEAAKLAENTFHAFTDKGIPTKNYDLCCKLRSGLYSQAGMKTVVIEKLEPGISYEFAPYRGATPLKITSDELLQSALPVVIKEIQVTAAEEPAAIVEPETQPAGML
ncbi:alpha/beta hydrolase family protein [Mariprofundus micogutta]|uniref:Alpha/beta hydrolase family protein n=2 Tax=Mariprofundus micogutta TaxID=1921010 RepID=A0A1L8CR22_9PROT|nr:alpha/beta hydrolase family protein [Mariprofundus micogutta]